MRNEERRNQERSKTLDRPSPKVPSPNPQPYERAVRVADRDPVRKDFGEGSVATEGELRDPISPQNRGLTRKHELVGRDYDASLGREGRGSEKRGGELSNADDLRGESTRPAHDFDDPAIQKRIMEALQADKSVDAKNISVKVSAGIVTLSGKVPDRHQLRALDSIVNGIAGVEQFVSNVSVAD